MFKTFLILSFCLLLGPVSSEARAPYSRAEFIHLPDGEKNRFIIKTMEMIVELESKYQKEVVSQNADPQKIHYYTKLIQELKSLLISNAYAAALATPRARDPKDFEKIAEDFANLLKKPEVCIYGGWISRMSLKGMKLADGTTTKRSICLHPNHITDGTQATSYPPETLAYASDESCSGKNRISCNPVIFGYKKQSANTLFCVDAGVSRTGVSLADNSALHCMRAALEEKSSDDQDSVATRLSFLRKALSEKPAIYESVQQVVFKSCICVDPKNNFNRDYLKYMQPHQTCYGMMEMMAETTICEDPKFAMDTSFFESIRNYAKGKFDRLTSSPNEVKDYYRSFVLDVQKNTPEEYTKFCGGTPPVVVKPETKPEEVKDETPPPKKTYSCRSAVCAPKAKAAEATTSAPAPETTNTPAAESNGTELTCQYEVVDQEGSIAEFKESKQTVSTGETTTLSLEGTVGEEQLTLECTAELKTEAKPTQEDDKMPSLDVTKVAQGIDKYKVIAKISEPNEGWSFHWKIKNNGSFKPKEGWKESTPTTPKPEIKLAGEEESEDATPPETTTPPGATRDNLETIQARATVNYDVCGEISKGDKRQEKCVTIDMLKPTTKGPGAMGGPGGPTPPQVRMRGSSDTSAVGIK